MTASAHGIDISSFQPAYTAAQLEPYDFAFFRATVGTTDTDANFAANWAAGKAARIHRGAYHELTDLSPVSMQAEHFIATVRGQGVEAGDMFAVSASDYAGVTAAAVLEFAGAVRAAFPDGPVLVYSDGSMLQNLGGCEVYPLWLAAYSGLPGSVAPWASWTFWQSSGTGVDADVYNGTAAELQAWLDSFAAAPAPAAGMFGPPRNLRVTGGVSSARFEWDPPADPPAAPGSYLIWAYRGAVCDDSTLVPSYPRAAAASPCEDPQDGSLPPGDYTAHVAVQEPSAHVTPGVFASAPFTTG